VFCKSILRSLFLVLVYSTILHGQPVKNTTIRYSEQTKQIIKTLDSLYRTDAHKQLTLCVESEYIGDTLVPSEKFKLYTMLINTASRPELISIVNDKSTLIPIRAYAYMAYMYQCDKRMAMSQRFNCTFKVNVLIGNIPKRLSFSDLYPVGINELNNSNGSSPGSPTEPATN
jgi:hypothetical protein